MSMLASTVSCLSSIAEQFAWRRLATPLSESRALEGDDGTSPEAVLSSVIGTDERTYAACLEALNTNNESNFIRTVPAFLTHAECTSLRAWCDERIEDNLALDNVDRLPDFQVNVAHLEDIVSSTRASSLLSLPFTALGATNKFRRVGVFIRRYSPETRCYFPFHVDGNAFTVNVALSSPDAYDGGHLRCIVAGRVETLVRDEGDATVHRNSVCHAVAPVERGVRHSMLLFFHD